MKASELQIQLAALEASILRLAANYSSEKKEKDLLKIENLELKTIAKNQSAEIKILRKKTDKIENDFQNSQKITKLVKSIQTDTKDTEELKKKLDEYIHEISKCINYLSQ